MFYVTAVDGPDVHFMSGPYRDKQTAERAVSDVESFCSDPDNNRSWYKAHFMSWGVSRWKGEEKDSPKSVLGIAFV